MGLTRPQAISRRMDAAAHGLRGAMANLARMLAIVDYEHEEDKRVFGYSRNPAPHYVNLREAARGAVEEAGAPAARCCGCLWDHPSEGELVCLRESRASRSTTPNTPSTSDGSSPKL